ncbi:MAG: LytTR family DNA-binding domain-containing protein [Saprospiraceae bacterium]
MTKKVRCLVVDDEPLAIDILKEYIQQVDGLELITTCSTAMDAFSVITKQEIDLIFLDIEMPDLNGLELVKTIKKGIKVIVTTAYREYAIEGYELDILDYLLKPISFQRFFKSVNKYLRLANNNNMPRIESGSSAKPRGSMFIYADKKNFKVYFDDILYLESIKDYVRIHILKKNIITKGTISHFEGLLPSCFLRIHRSYIVNTSKINAFTNHDVEINNKEIPIGVSYKRAVLESLKE